MANNTSIKLELTRIDSGLVRADVSVINAPADTFGAAFDLVISGGDWSLKSYEAGELFRISGTPPLMMAVEKTVDSHRIVTGMSLKRGVNLESDGGTLISFYINASGDSAFKISFANNVLSALRDGNRMDLKETGWMGAEIMREPLALDGNAIGGGTMFLSAAGGLQTGGSQISGASGTQVTDATLAQANLFGNSHGDSAVLLWWEDPVAQVYIFLGIALVVMILVISALIVAKKIKFN
jgi:hypothetical protein